MMIKETGSPLLGTALKLTLAAIAAGAGWGQYQNYYQTKPYVGYKTNNVKSRTGNTLKVVYREPSPTSNDVFVLIPGLASSVSSLAGVADALAATGAGIILHNRAGYGGSKILNDEPFHVAEAVADLHSVLEWLSQETEQQNTQIHMVGHSLGGYIAHEYAVVHPAKVKSIFYLDPLHPNEIVNSEAQRRGSAGVDLAMRTITPFVPFGASLLFRKNVIEYAARYRYKNRVKSDLHSPKVWSAARREWESMYSIMLDGRQLEGISRDIRSMVLVAADTAKAEPEQVNLYRDYSDHLEIIENVDHQTLVTSAKGISAVTTKILS